MLLFLFLILDVLCRRRVINHAWSDCEPPQGGFVLGGPIARVNDIQLGRENYAPGDDLYVTIRGVVEKGCLDSPLLEVEVKLEGVLMRTFHYSICDLEGASCPSCAGEEYEFSLEQPIPRYGYLRGKTLDLKSKVYNGPYIVSCTMFSLTLSSE